MNKTKRVLLAGLYHETHTFLDEVTGLDAFQTAHGEELLDSAGDSSPLGGALDAAQRFGWELAPVIDMRAMPGGTVADAVVEHFWSAVADALADHPPAGLDGVFLVLHGAMASESFTDVEGEILERIRALPSAARLPVCGVLDLHANFTERMARLSDGLVAYRENPHTDAKQAAEDAAALLERVMRTGVRPVTVWERAPAMWPATGTGTANDPMRALEERARAAEREEQDILFVNVCSGCAFTDAPETSACFTAITLGDPDQARGPLAELRDIAIRKRRCGNVLDMPPAEALSRLRTHTEGPVVLVEPSDNIGGGAPGDGTGLLRFFLENGISNAAIAINDPRAAAVAHLHAPGARLDLEIGGRGSRFDAGPLPVRVDLLSLTDGRFELEDKQSHLASMFGSWIDMGPCAVVRHRGVRILLTSRKTPPFDLGQLRSQGIAPEDCFAIGVKAAVAHRRAYDPVAKAMYWIDTPGPCSSNLGSFPYRRIHRPIFPLDDLEEWPVDA
ncbi:MAG: M81 family metallopeptidase [Candidatus Hydrogenedentes bacterium]|nr:M81 family metallopeptidase [Candidatus Hydrogenedentota bacterium]